MKVSNLLAGLVSGLAVFCGGSSIATAAGLGLSYSLDDGSNFNASVGDYPEGEQLSLGTALNVEHQRVDYGSMSIWTLGGDPTHFQGTLSISGYEEGTMALAPFRSLSFNVGGMHLFIGANVDSYSSQNHIPELFYGNWGNVALSPGSSFNYVNFDPYSHLQDDGVVYFSNVYTFGGTRVALPGQVLKGFSMTQTLSTVPEPTTLASAGSFLIFGLRRRK
jgi:hypothetical protein